MGISVADNFDHKSKKPLDARTSYSTLALMKAVIDANMNEGCLAYCAETDKYYKFLSTNTVDESTGKWREFSSGGGSTGGGHTIEDSTGTDLTQRSVMQFGEGFIAEDDSTNEKTVISPDVMPSEDMSEVVSPLPSVRARGVKYSTEEQVIGEWINGKTIYQKSFEVPMSGGTKEGSLYFKQLDVSSLNIDNYVSCEAVLKGTSICKTVPLLEYASTITRAYSIFGWTTSIVQINVSESNSTHLEEVKASTAYITIQYTKTTDTAQ